MVSTVPSCLPDLWLKHIHFEKEFDFKNSFSASAVCLLIKSKKQIFTYFMIIKLMINFFFCSANIYTCYSEHFVCCSKVYIKNYVLANKTKDSVLTFNLA